MKWEMHAWNKLNVDNKLFTIRADKINSELEFFNKYVSGNFLKEEIIDKSSN